MPQLLYNLHSLALQGEITRPFQERINPQPASAVLTTDGVASYRADKFSLGNVLSHKGARGHIETAYNSQTDEYHAVAHTVLQGLNISNVVTIDQIAARLVAVFSTRQDEPGISPLGSMIVNLRVAGHPIELIPLVGMYQDLNTMQKLRHRYRESAEFRQSFAIDSFVGRELELPEQTHKFFPWRRHKSSGELPEFRGHTIVPLFRIVDPKVPGIQVHGNVIEIHDFGRLVVGELYISDGERRVVMIQADLGSPVEGYLAVCAATAGCESASGEIGVHRETRRPPGLAAGPAYGASDSGTGESEPAPAPAVAVPAPPSLHIRLPQTATAEIPSAVTWDAVHFSIAAPAIVAPDTRFELTFFAHLGEQRDEVLARAIRTIGDQHPLFRSEGPVQVARGTDLQIRVSIPGFKTQPNQKTLLWIGEIAVAGFIVSVPFEAALGRHPGKASVRLNGLQIASVDFLLTVGPAARPVECAPVQSAIHRSAFASYASEDRDEVLACVQVLHKEAPHLEVFVDLVSLRSGQLWEPELRKRISQADIFYLFWCRHAMSSNWVAREWQWALAKGLDFIDPVPLEGPELAPPPAELAAKHFNDPLLASHGKGHHSQASVP